MADTYHVVGAGGHSKVVIDALRSAGNRVAACYDDNPALLGSWPVPGVQVVGPAGFLDRNRREGEFVILAVGDNAARRRLSLRWSVFYGLVVASSVVLGSEIVLGEGSVILPSATVNIGTVLGRHVVLNTSCSVDHDCRVGDYCHIGPGCRLGGSVAVDEGTFLGIGVKAIPGVRIGRWSVIGAGAVVTRDLPDNCTAVGVPAKVVKTREEGWHLR